MSNKKTNNTRLIKLTQKKEKEEARYNLLREEFMLDAEKFEDSIDYVLSNNHYYRNFLEWLSMFDLDESIIANKVLKYTLQSVDDKCIKDLFNDFNMEKYNQFLLLHEAIKDVTKYLSECRKKEIELNKLAINLYIDNSKIKVLEKIKRQ